MRLRDRSWTAPPVSSTRCRRTGGRSRKFGMWGTLSPDDRRPPPASELPLRIKILAVDILDDQWRFRIALKLQSAFDDVRDGAVRLFGETAGQPITAMIARAQPIRRIRFHFERIDHLDVVHRGNSQEAVHAV